MTPGLRDFLDAIPEGTYRAVISGSLEEVRYVLQQHGIADYFDAIYGSPRTKDEAFAEIGHTQPLGREAVYLGDSRYDFEVADRFGMDFVFVSGHTEFEGWRSHFDDGVPVVEHLSSITPA